MNERTLGSFSNHARLWLIKSRRKKVYLQSLNADRWTRGCFSKKGTPTNARTHTLSRLGGGVCTCWETNKAQKMFTFKYVNKTVISMNQFCKNLKYINQLTRLFASVVWKGSTGVVCSVSHSFWNVSLCSNAAWHTDAANDHGKMVYGNLLPHLHSDVLQVSWKLCNIQLLLLFSGNDRCDVLLSSTADLKQNTQIDSK